MPSMGVPVARPSEARSLRELSTDPAKSFEIESEGDDLHLLRTADPHSQELRLELRAHGHEAVGTPSQHSLYLKEHPCRGGRKIPVQHVAVERVDLHRHTGQPRG